MKYQIKTISNKAEIDSCPQFQIDRYNWGGDYRPEAFGSLAFIPGTGFYIKMTCREKDPIRTYTRPNDPVYLDSAMEAFFQFYPEEFPEMYLNFEFNSNGAMLAKYGNGRKDRKPYPEAIHASCSCTGTVYEDHWTAELTIPLSLLDYVYGKSDFKSGDVITCNFYKIKESEGLTHFGSYTVIENETPNFHLPQFFATATID